MNRHRIHLTAALALATALLLNGCVAAIGNRDAKAGNGTLGQQLVDLKKAKEAGAITDTEYEVQKARLLNQK
jgi:PBP1b-binding outer membrane lipoprotein LpoB